LAAVFTAGCGSKGNPFQGGSTPLSGNTSVTLLASSTANDQISVFDVEVLGMTLTNQSGKTVNLLSPLPTAPFMEFMHLNGTAEPMLTVSVPQDVYSSATLTLGTTQFGCVIFSPTYGNLDTIVFNDFLTPASQVTVSLAEPITVTGDAMGLSLDLLVGKSATYNSCTFSANQPNAIVPYTISPTFNLTPVSFPSQPGNGGSTPLTGLTGTVASVNAMGNSFLVTGADGPVWTANTNGSTVFHGVAGVSALAAGMLVDMNAAIQADGSLLATRVEVDDTNSTNLSLAVGPVSQTAPNSNFFSVGQETQGYLYVDGASTSQTFTTGSGVYQISGELANVQSLPFTASFSAANIVAGQNVLVTSHGTVSGGYLPVSTLTLIPQTINGTVTAVSSSGGFEMYTVALAAYDSLPNLSGQNLQNPLVNPGSVVVYVDSNTALLNSGAIAVGSLLRFNGLLFNDKGSLRMDCAQVSDGVTE
jgi:Domain of unknown function (DUF5666)